MMSPEVSHISGKAGLTVLLNTQSIFTSVSLPTLVFLCNALYLPPHIPIF